MVAQSGVCMFTLSLQRDALGVAGSQKEAGAMFEHHGGPKIVRERSLGPLVPYARVMLPCVETWTPPSGALEKCPRSCSFL